MRSSTSSWKNTIQHTMFICMWNNEKDLKELKVRKQKQLEINQSDIKWTELELN